jgi:hypothetical protein
MVKSGANPEGLPMEVFDGLRASLVKDPSQFYKDLAIMFYGANRAGAKVSQGILDQFWLWSMQAVCGVMSASRYSRDRLLDLKVRCPGQCSTEDDRRSSKLVEIARPIRGATESVSRPHPASQPLTGSINSESLEFLKKA